MYTIKIHYETGDSFNTYYETDLIGMTWENLDKAKQALKEIREHYELVYELERSYTKTQQKKVLKKIKKKPWAPDVNYNYEYEHSIMLETDNGERKLVNCFWCGYFETLNLAEIIIDDDDLCIYF